MERKRAVAKLFKDKITSKNMDMSFGEGGEIGDDVLFKSYGETRKGSLSDKLKNGWEVQTTSGTVFVEPREIISFSTPVARKKVFGMFNKGGSLTNERRHVNKSEDYEVRYAKDKPTRTGYKNKRDFEKGGELESKIAKFEKSLTSELVPEKIKVTIRAEISKLKAEIESNKKPEIEAKKPIVEKAPIKKDEPKKDEFKSNYMMLGRLQTDNDYFLGAGNRSESQLWAGNVKDQIAEMKKLWGELPKDGKPEWLSMSDIEDYESKMKTEDEPKKPIVRKPVVKKVVAKTPVVEVPKAPTKKPDHKKLLAKTKAKKTLKDYNNSPSEGHKRDEAKDRKLKALPLGKRVSKSGNVYYENRLNRADFSSKKRFDKGGDIESSGFSLDFLNW